MNDDDYDNDDDHQVSSEARLQRRHGMVVRGRDQENEEQACLGTETEQKPTVKC